jgi:HAD superfamily hydrolase (TIGR01509 family)
MPDSNVRLKPFDLIIFDCDGVLVDSEVVTNRVFVEVLNERGVPATIDDMFSYFVGHSLQQCLDLVWRIYGYRVDALFLDAYKTRRDQALAKEVKAVNGIAEVLQQISQPFCVASNSERQKVESMLRLTQLDTFFGDRIYSAADLGKPKPAPDVYLHVAHQYGVLPAQCVVIEDTPVGAQAAVSAGMTVLGYAALTPEARLIEAGVSSVFKSMKALPLLLNSREIA